MRARLKKVPNPRKLQALKKQPHFSRTLYQLLKNVKANRVFMAKTGIRQRPGLVTIHKVLFGPTLDLAEALGLVTIPAPPAFGKRSYVTLTSTGLEALHRQQLEATCS